MVSNYHKIYWLQPLSTLRLAHMPLDILIHIAHIYWTNEASESCCYHKEGIAPGHRESLKNERLTSIPSMFESFWLIIIQVFPNYRPCYFVGSHPCLAHIAHWGCQIGTIAEWREAPPSTTSRREGLLGAWEGPWDSEAMGCKRFLPVTSLLAWPIKTAVLQVKPGCSFRHLTSVKVFAYQYLLQALSR